MSSRSEIDRAKAKAKRRNLRDKKRQAASQVKSHKKNVGSSAYIASLDGFTKKNKLPAHFNELINNVRRFVFTRKLEVDSGGITQAMSSKVQAKLFEVLVTMLTTCDLVSGQIGKAKNIGMDTTSHDALMLQHAKRFGHAIPSSTWYRYIEILKSSGVLVVQEAKVASTEDNTVRSVAAYKWLSAKFLLAIGAYSDNIKAGIKAAYKKAIDKGLCFIWRKFKKQLPSKHRFTEELFPEYTPPPIH